MPVRALVPDHDSLTLTIISDHAAPVDAVWALWADPAMLGAWWGPPGFPCTVDHHDLAVGSRVAYHMTGPDGTEYPGWWRVLEVEEPRRLALEDGFTGPDGEPDADMPVSALTVTLADTTHGVEMTLVSTFPDRAAMDQLIAMGALEGMQAAMSQIDALLAHWPVSRSAAT